MKKKIFLILGILLCIVLFAVDLFVVRTDGDAAGTARYIYGDKNIVTEISQEDTRAIADIFNGKFTDIFVLPSCGFDEIVVVIIGGKTFCIACGECGEVYYKERKGYFSLTDGENRTLRTILEKYVFSWSCV